MATEPARAGVAATAAVRKPSRTDNVYALVKGMILSGEIDPVDRIDAHRLVDMLGFGRTPVREALLRLQSEGIVTIVPQRGVRIVTLSADDLTEIYQVISAVEIEAVRLLAEFAPRTDRLDALTAASDRLAAAAQTDDREDWVSADEAFHRAILELNPNRRLREVGLLHRDLAQRAHFVALRMLRPDQLTESARQHSRLIELILAGDVEAAVASHRTQRDRGAELLVGVLRHYRMTQI
jgi:DNA-binding GntR family transcriptional regulator